MRVLLVGLILFSSIGFGAAQPPEASPAPDPAPVPESAPDSARAPVPPPIDGVPVNQIRIRAPVFLPAQQFRGLRAGAQRRRAPILSDLVLAKIDQAGRLIMMIESHRTEKRTVKVTSFKRETRSRNVVVDGKSVTQDYTVNVPVTEDREVDMNVPAGPKPVTLEPKEVRFFNLKGEQVAIDEVAKSHLSLSPIFLIDKSDSDPLPLSTVATNAIKENCYIAVTEKRLRGGSMPPNAPFALPPAPLLPALPAAQLRPAKP